MSALLPVVVVTGSRDWSDPEVVRHRLLLHCRSMNDGYSFILLHGGCRGADEIAGEWARTTGYAVEVPVPYFDWMAERGGPARNRALLAIAKAYRERGHSVVFEAFPLPKGKGTQHMMELAEAAGFTVYKTQSGWW